MVANGGYHYLERNQAIKTGRLISAKGKRIYFIRFVESFEHAGGAHVVILNERVSLPEKYAHQFVFVKWDLEREQLSIYSEYKAVSTCTRQIQFKLNL